MMFHLVCQTTAEPRVKDRGRDIAGGVNLKADEISVTHFLACEHLHCIMTDGENNSEKNPTE